MGVICAMVKNNENEFGLKKTKTGPTYSEKWHETHIKKQNVF
jgi:hypothetical protein